jgi:tellurite resistance protein TerB
MTGLVTRARSLLARHGERVRERQFLDAVMAAGALVAAVDGEVSLPELLSRDAVLERVDALQAFDSSVAVRSFESFVADIAADPEAGSERALAAVSRFGNDAEAAQLLLRAAVAIAKADARFTTEEQRTVARLCEALGMEELDLGAEDSA